MPSPTIPADIQALLETTPGRINAITDHLERRDHGRALKKVIDAWKEQQAQDRTLRKQYALTLIVIMIVQIIAINLVYILIGCKVLRYESWTARTFIMAVFAEITALVLVVVRYLFSSSSDKLLEIVLPKSKGRDRRRITR